MGKLHRLRTVLGHVSAAGCAAGTLSDVVTGTELLVPPPASVGDKVEDVDTPALLVDLAVLEANLQRMADLTSSR